MSVNTYDEDKSPRHSYPRPTLVRQNWINLNGTWNIEFDDEGHGMKGRWYRRGNYSRTVAVPFPFESPLSGIGDNSVHPRVWYSRKFDLDKEFRDSRWLLHFGAVDYSARVWVNGKTAGSHRGGYTPFSMDITKLIKPQDNLLVVYAEDLPTGEQCRGLQTVSSRPDTGSYERTTGIWQTVWLEPVPDEYILDHHTVSTSRDGRVEFEVRVASPQPDTEFMIRIYLGGMEVASYSTAAAEFIRFAVNLSDVKCWSPDDPVLYTTEMLLLRDGHAIDKARSYFGVRTVEILGDKILLNGTAYYLRMVMDHRYYPDGYYTAPHDAMIKHDVELAKKLGFNSIRTVHKTPEPQFLYWCDKLGILVWEGMPGFVEYSKSAGRQYMKEWIEMFARDCNHPSVVTWVLFENGFGINGPKSNDRPVPSVRDSAEVQKFVREAVGMVRAVDPHRLVIDNSGCLHLDTDIVDIHEMAATPEELEKRVRTHWLGKRDHWVEGCELMAADTEYTGQPIVLSDYGGLTLNDIGISNDGSSDTNALSATYETFAKTIAKFQKVCGRCYRQLTDVCSDMTGLATADRHPKVDCELIYQINRKYPKSK